MLLYNIEAIELFGFHSVNKGNGGKIALTTLTSFMIRRYSPTHWLNKTLTALISSSRLQRAYTPEED